MVKFYCLCVLELINDAPPLQNESLSGLDVDWKWTRSGLEVTCKLSESGPEDDWKLVRSWPEYDPNTETDLYQFSNRSLLANPKALGSNPAGFFGF